MQLLTLKRLGDKGETARAYRYTRYMGKGRYVRVWEELVSLVNLVG